MQRNIGGERSEVVMGRSLACAVRAQVVLKYLGQLMLLLAALDRLPAVVALGYGESELALRFSIVVLIRVSVSAW